MKKILAVITFIACTVGFVQAKELKVLTIGNSFADSVFAYLPKIVKSQQDCKLKIARANHGGCTLDRHWYYAEKEENSPSENFYTLAKRKCKLRDILQSEKWDIVTIQQASHKSWDADSYQPYADNLVAYIKKYAPSAEIVIQQTWSYRADAPHFKKWGFDQNEMFGKLEKNYRELSEHFGARVIPSGLAVQTARKTQPEDCKIFDAENLKKLAPNAPDQSKFVVGNTRWVLDKKTKEKKFKTDYIHLNDRGRYMQACLWFGFLFDKNPEEITFKPENMSDSDANFLKKCAAEALKYKQTGLSAKTKSGN